MDWVHRLNSIVICPEDKTRVLHTGGGHFVRFFADECVDMFYLPLGQTYDYSTFVQALKAGKRHFPFLSRQKDEFHLWAGKGVRDKSVRGLLLPYSDLSNISFWRSVMSEAVFENCYIDHSSFVKTHLGGASFQDSFVFDSFINQSLLFGASFARAVVVSTKFRNSWMHKVCFNDAVFTKCDFKGCFLQGSSFRNTQFIECSFDKASLAGVDMEGAVIDGVSVPSNPCPPVDTAYVHKYIKEGRSPSYFLSNPYQEYNDLYGFKKSLGYNVPEPPNIHMKPAF